MVAIYEYIPTLPPEAADADITSQISNTPLLRLARIAGEYGVRPGVEIYAKAEWFNPGGSVKDRAALYMIRDGERRGLLSPGKTILDASSGNTGISYAMIGATLGYPVEICLPSTASPERKQLLRLYGAKVIDTPAALGTDGAILEARRLYAEAPERYFYPDQYNNPANWQAHFYGTGPEIWRQTHGRVTHFVAVLGTSGTFTGTTRRLKAYNPAIQVAEVQPASAFHGLEGMKHMASALVPGIYNSNLADLHLTVETEEAQAATRALARYEGILAGPSGGAAVLAALQVAQSLDTGVVVTILPDGGTRYLGDSFWNEE
ncbi:MAG TPA: cysteine synthase family protein [Chloroflexia bacterium]|nr:cysteine synthase family protein [Chloroflexia bacterium]